MNLEDIKGLIDKDIEEAFDVLDGIFGDSNSMYNDLNKKYVDPPENFNMTFFRSKLKRCVQISLGQKKRLNSHQIYLCNRQKQYETFQHYILNEPKKVHTFFIHGDEQHGHDAIFKRFYYELINENHAAKGKLFKVCLHDVTCKLFKIKLLHRFIKNFQINVNACIAGGENLSYILQKEYHSQRSDKNQPIIVKVDISYDKWHPSVFDDIEWFIRHFCNATSLQEGMPKVYIFFIMKYLTTNDSKPFRFFTLKKPKSKKQRIIEKIRQMPIDEIDELDSVKHSEVEDWLANYAKIEKPESRKRIIEKLTNANGSNRHYYMNDIVNLFDRIIKHHINRAL